jgi:hypothetical protein
MLVLTRHVGQEIGSVKRVEVRAGRPSEVSLDFRASRERRE